MKTRFAQGNPRFAQIPGLRGTYAHYIQKECDQSAIRDLWECGEVNRFEGRAGGEGFQSCSLLKTAMFLLVLTMQRGPFFMKIARDLGSV